MSADGDVLGSWTAGKDFALVTFSSADVESGAEYTVVVDGTEVATATAGEFSGGGMAGGGMGGDGRPGRGSPRLIPYSPARAASHSVEPAPVGQPAARLTVADVLGRPVG